MLVGLALKGIEYELHNLNFTEGEHRSPFYRKLNPRSRVPTVVFENLVITDSLAILSWLDQRFPQTPSLFGVTAQDHARVWNATRDATDHLREAMRALLTPIFFEGATHASPELLNAGEHVREELTVLEQRLTKNRFVALNTPSAADAVCFAEVQILKRAISTRPKLLAELGFESYDQSSPAQGAWLNAMLALDGIKETFPTHWRDDSQ